jgi:phosphatidylinositol 4-kinase
MLLTQDWERARIWHDRTGTIKQPYLDSVSYLEYVTAASHLSLPLAIHTALRYPYLFTRDLPAVLEHLVSAPGRARIDTPALVAFWLQHGLPFDDPRRLILAPGLSPLSAINIFRTPSLSSRPLTINYAMRSLESVPPDSLYFYIPHMVQALRHDTLGYIERTIMHVARTSSLFAHQIIWNLKANTYQDDMATVPDPCKEIFEEMIEKVSRLLAGIDREFFEREFAFFDRVTAISGALKPFVKKEKWEKKVNYLFWYFLSHYFRQRLMRN